MLPPPRNGTRIRFVELPPDTEELLRRGAGDVREPAHREIAAALPGGGKPIADGVLDA